MTRRLRNDDRAVSIAVTHVLTIAVTTLIIGGLMMGTGYLLENEKEKSAEDSLETIGERLSSQLSSVDRATADGGEATIWADHPQTVAGSGYTIELLDDGVAGEKECSDQPLLSDEIDQCLILTYHGGDVEVAVPVTVTDVEESSTQGGTIEIYGDDGTVRLGGASA